MKTPELLRLPLDRNLSRLGHRFVRDAVTGIDPETRTVELASRRPMGYDALIVALGGVDATHGVPGVGDHALGFKSVDQCQQIGERLGSLARRKQGRIVIIGGGLEGVEALGEILRSYRHSGLQITLVEAGEHLLAGAPVALDGTVRELSAPYDVRFQMGSRVERIGPEVVVLENGQSLSSDLSIWTGGPAPPSLLADSGLAPRDAWAPVEATLQSRGHPEIFVVGDAAELPTALSKQAYHAIDMGHCAARNASALLSRARLEPFRPSGKPTLISFGDLSCFLVLGGRSLAGPALGAGKEAVFELVMSQLDAQSATTRVSRVAERVARATSQLLWPTLSSPTQLLRQTRLSLL